jgi:hypothetical protein
LPVLPGMLLGEPPLPLGPLPLAPLRLVPLVLPEAPPGPDGTQFAAPALPVPAVLLLLDSLPVLGM